MIANLPKGHVEVDFDVLIHETSGAYLLLICDSQVWIPKSQVHELFEDGDGKTVIIPEWLATAKDLI